MHLCHMCRRQKIKIIFYGGTSFIVLRIHVCQNTLIKQTLFSEFLIEFLGYRSTYLSTSTIDIIELEKTLTMRNLSNQDSSGSVVKLWVFSVEVPGQ